MGGMWLYDPKMYKLYMFCQFDHKLLSSIFVVVDNSQYFLSLLPCTLIYAKFLMENKLFPLRKRIITVFWWKW